MACEPYRETTSALTPCASIGAVSLGSAPDAKSKARVALAPLLWICSTCRPGARRGTSVSPPWICAVASPSTESVPSVRSVEREMRAGGASRMRRTSAGAPVAAVTSNVVEAFWYPVSVASARWLPGGSWSTQVEDPHGFPSTEMAAPSGEERSITLKVAATTGATARCRDGAIRVALTMIKATAASPATAYDRCREAIPGGKGSLKGLAGLAGSAGGGGETRGRSGVVAGGGGACDEL